MHVFEKQIFCLFDIGNSIQLLNKKAEKQLGLSLVQWCLLRVLIDMPGSPANILAKSVGVHPSSLTQTLKRLEKKKYIFIALDPKDFRRKLVSITRLGRDTLETTRVTMENLSAHLSQLTVQMDSLSEFLQSHTLQKR